MSVKSDRWILTQCREYGLITPFAEHLIREVKDCRIISAGLSSYGYDLRLAPDGFRVFSPIASAEIDPKNFDERSLTEAPLRTAGDGSQYWLLPPHSYALGVTLETFNMPRNVIGFCLGKSTYARCGLIVNATPLEPGWRGRLVLEFSNSADLPIRIYANEGIAQVTFFESDEECATSYADRGGKYQDQAGLVTARL
ncbi:MAG TPA: dCTP deaminase [Blastocatellia bacterium]|nr:dCTP deaminase [Blastocatellia bacterium]